MVFWFEKNMKNLSHKTTLEIRSQTLQLFAGVCGERDRGKDAKFYRKGSARVLDDFFFSFLEEARIQNLMECGAHEATASRKFLNNGGARAITIEANPDIYERKTRKASELGAEVLNVGLAEKAGTLDFHIPDKNLGAASFRTKRDGQKTIRVKTTTIDDLRLNHGLKGGLALWVDVEGFAFEVLKGAEKTLEDPETLILKVEMEHRPRWRDQRTYLEVAALLETAGFVPIIGDIEYVDQFNIVYARKELVADHRQLITLVHSCMRDLVKLVPS